MRPASISFLISRSVIRRDAAGGANRGDAEREIETREADAHVRVHRRRATHRKEHVVVHADEAGQDRVAFEIERLRIGRNLRDSHLAQLIESFRR